jgi:hypothetical protein
MGKQEIKRPLNDLVVGEKIILKWILWKYSEVMWTRFVCLRIQTSGEQFAAFAFSRPVMFASVLEMNVTIAVHNFWPN